MNDWDFHLDFKNGVLTYQYNCGQAVYVGGAEPYFSVQGQPVRGHNDPDYPISLFAQELEGDEFFFDDPIDCTPGGTVLLGSGREVLLHTLPPREQDYALKQMSLVAFQQTVPFEIKERLQEVYCSRWKLYELFAYVPASMEFFDRNPALALLLAHADTWRPERGAKLWETVGVQLGEAEDDDHLLEWLGVRMDERLGCLIKGIASDHLSINDLKRMIDLQENPILFDWLAGQGVEDFLVGLLGDQQLWPNLSPGLLNDVDGEWSALNWTLNHFSKYVRFLGWQESMRPLESKKELDQSLKSMRYQVKDWLLHAQSPIFPPSGTSTIRKCETFDEALTKYETVHWLPQEVYGLGWQVYYLAEHEAVLVIEREGVYSNRWKVAWAHEIPRNFPLDNEVIEIIWTELNKEQELN